jgi:hypothetical protein
MEWLTTTTRLFAAPPWGLNDEQIARVQLGLHVAALYGILERLNGSSSYSGQPHGWSQFTIKGWLSSNV